jgi:hypothetical protein
MALVEVVEGVDEAVPAIRVLVLSEGECLGLRCFGSGELLGRGSVGGGAPVGQGTRGEVPSSS